MTRKEAIEWLEQMQTGLDICKFENDAIDVAIEALSEPGIVRCRYCKHWNSKTDLTHCDKTMWIGTDAGDYCSFGERKDNG